MAGSSALTAGAAGAPKLKVDFGGSAGAGVDGLAPKSKVAFGAVDADAAGAAEGAPNENELATGAGLSASGVLLPNIGAASAGFENCDEQLSAA